MPVRERAINTLVGRPTHSALVERSGVGGALPYLPGLDGLRAVAVLAVLLYHSEWGWLAGGFLGVEVFFVISGYLLTTLLLAEWWRSGRIDLRHFWMRRARRLLPALYGLLIVTLAFAVGFLPDEVARLRADALAAWAYVTNWYLIFNQTSYFETVGRPSLLRHLWSLAVEEQFYVLWPLLLGLGLRRWPVRRVLLVVLAAALASTLWMAWLYQPDVDPSRLYYGTDTRAAGFLIGAALAFVWTPARLRGSSRATGFVLDAVGFVALGELIWFFLDLNEFQPFLYRGGFAAVAVVTVAIIAAVVHPGTRLVSGVLGCWPLRWIGLRSYSIYLWHWPVFMVTRPQLDVPLDGPIGLALRLALTLAFAELSYRMVETPIRKGALSQAWQALGEARGSRRWLLSVRWAGFVAGIVVVSGMLGRAVAYARPPAPPPYLALQAIHTGATIAPPTSAPSAIATARLPTPTATSVPTAIAAPTQATLPTATPPPAPSAEPTPLPPSPTAAPIGPVFAIGDSVMLGAATNLVQTVGNLECDAAVSRQVGTALDVLRRRSSAGQLGAVVVVHVGNNGTFSAQQFDTMMQLLAGVRKVVFVNVKVPRPWEGPNNAVIAEGVQRYPNAVLVDWRAASIDHPEYFYNDGIHLQPAGAQAYTELLAAQISAP